MHYVDPVIKNFLRTNQPEDRALISVLTRMKILTDFQNGFLMRL
jgi:hypothetical protein